MISGGGANRNRVVEMLNLWATASKQLQLPLCLCAPLRTRLNDSREQIAGAHAISR